MPLVRENLSFLNEVFKGADLDGSTLLRNPINAMFCFFWSGRSVISFITTNPLSVLISRLGALVAKDK